MSGINIIHHKGELEQSAKVAIVASRFNNFVVDKLYDGAIKTLEQHGIKESDITVVYVPGAFEIPVAVKKLISSDEKLDAIITLGAVIRGETPHFEYICDTCANGIASLALENSVPIIFGVLTVDNTEQALDRAGEQESNKGAESALAALEMIGVCRQIK